jgi:hypothetical protein
MPVKTFVETIFPTISAETVADWLDRKTNQFLEQVGHHQVTAIFEHDTGTSRIRIIGYVEVKKLELAEL